MAYDDYLYLVLVCSSIPLGFGLKAIKGPTYEDTVTRRYVYCFVVGLMQAILGTRSQMWHCCLTIAANYLLLKFVNLRYPFQPHDSLYNENYDCVKVALVLHQLGSCPIYSFSMNFGYLLFFRSMYLLGFDHFTGPTNAVQLVLTLKMVSLAFDARDAGKRYDLIPFLSYSFCFQGFLIGPFFKYSTFHDAITNPYLSDLATAWPAVKELIYVPLYAVVHLVLKHYFPEEHLLSSQYLHHPWGFWYRMAYTYPLLLWFRWRFYIGWQIAVAGCVAAGLGAYPLVTAPRPGQGPTTEGEGKEWKVARPGAAIDFTTVQQLHVWELETMTKMTAGIVHWNMTVQFWMYHYVSRQFPWRPYRKLAVFAVAAFWHGLHLGYYVASSAMLFFAIAQDGFVAATAPLRTQPLKAVWAFVDWCVTWNMYSYLQLPFRLLTLDAMLTVWGSIYYIGHIICAVFCILYAYFQWQTASN